MASVENLKIIWMRNSCILVIDIPGKFHHQFVPAAVQRLYWTMCVAECCHCILITAIAHIYQKHTKYFIIFTQVPSGSK